MPAKPITAKQRHWLGHIKAADTSDGTLSDYAAKHDLNLKSLYQWKTKLLKLCLYSPDAHEPGSGFVSVRAESVAPNLVPGCSITLVNGTRIEFAGALDSQAIRAIMTSVGCKR